MGDTAYRMEALADDDDFAEADGDAMLTFGQAFEIALAWQPDLDTDSEHRREPLTVRRAVEKYLEWYKVHRRSYDRMRYNLRVHVLPELGEVKVEDLTSVRIRTWHQRLAEKPARLRGGQRREIKTEEQKRARKVVRLGRRR